MKFIFSVILIVLILSSCEEPKPLSENFWAIGYDGRGHEITLNDSMCFEVPTLKCIVFLYHDSIFKVEIDQKNKDHYSLLKTNTKAKDTLISIFDTYRKTTLNSQLKEIQEHGMKHGCFTDGYFLFSTTKKLQFGLFEFTKYYNWRSHYHSKEIILTPKQFPKIYQTIYHQFNSKWWDYYMSNEYHFKDLRVHYTSICCDH